MMYFVTPFSKEEPLDLRILNNKKSIIIAGCSTESVILAQRIAKAVIKSGSTINVITTEKVYYDSPEFVCSTYYDQVHDAEYVIYLAGMKRTDDSWALLPHSIDVPEDVLPICVNDDKNFYGYFNNVIHFSCYSVYGMTPNIFKLMTTDWLAIKQLERTALTEDKLSQERNAWRENVDTDIQPAAEPTPVDKSKCVTVTLQVEETEEEFIARKFAEIAARKKAR